MQQADQPRDDQADARHEDDAPGRHHGDRRQAGGEAAHQHPALVLAEAVGAGRAVQREQVARAAPVEQDAERPGPISIAWAPTDQRASRVHSRVKPTAPRSATELPGPIPYDPADRADAVTPARRSP
ncbi:hypothetical protein ACFC6L_13595 [Kitasatospora phosalacinea]|uniref:hypothetical protein n=1 Tax=Kitasatospora phosalacinea TaxID=2065 RepID=UPI0035DA37D1